MQAQPLVQEQLLVQELLVQEQPVQEQPVQEQPAQQGPQLVRRPRWWARRVQWKRCSGEPQRLSCAGS